MSKAKPTAKPAEKVEAAAPSPAAAPIEPAAAPAPATPQEPTPAPEPEPAAPAPSLEQLIATYVQPPAPAPAQPVEPLDDFLRRIEGANIDRDVYAVAATHPEATARIWPGTYSGIRLSRGDVSVTYSDGSQA